MGWRSRERVLDQMDRMLRQAKLERNASGVRRELGHIHAAAQNPNDLELARRAREAHIRILDFDAKRADLTATAYRRRGVIYVDTRAVATLHK